MSTALPAARGTLAARRLLLRGGLAAAPVLMTVVSRPVTAGGACTNASAFASLAASGASAVSSCSGRTPNKWVESKDWPGGLKPTSPVSAVYTSGSLYADESTLRDVLFQGRSGLGQTGVASFLLAAYLNSAKGLVPSNILDKGMALRIWQSFASLGYYEPTAGIRWNADAIVTWVRTTMQ